MPNQLFHFCPLIYFVTLDYRFDMTFEKIDIFSSSHTFCPDKRKPEDPDRQRAPRVIAHGEKIREGPHLITQTEAPETLNMIRFQIPAHAKHCSLHDPGRQCRTGKAILPQPSRVEDRTNQNPMDQSVMEAMQYHDISTGPAEEGTLNTGGLYRRHMTESILTFVEVGDIDKVLVKVEKLGGKITMPKEEITGVGLAAMIQDTEGNVIGLWKPAML